MKFSSVIMKIAYLNNNFDEHMHMNQFCIKKTSNEYI